MLCRGDDFLLNCGKIFNVYIYINNSRLFLL